MQWPERVRWSFHRPVIRVTMMDTRLRIFPAPSPFLSVRNGWEIGEIVIFVARLGVTLVILLCVSFEMRMEEEEEVTCWRDTSKKVSTKIWNAKRRFEEMKWWEDKFW